MVRNEIENQVVVSSAPGEILLRIVRIVNDPIGAEGSDHLHISGAANAGHVCAVRLGDLHGERAYASGGAVDQEVLPRLHVPLIAKTLQRRHGTRRRPRRLLGSGLRSCHRFDLAGDVHAEPGVLGMAQPGYECGRDMACLA